MRHTIILGIFLGLTLTNSAFSAMEPAAEQPQPAVVAPQALPPARALRQQLDTVIAQLDTMQNEQMTAALTACQNALTQLQGSMTPYYTAPAAYDHPTTNIARTMHSFFETLKTKITTCRNQIAHLPQAGGATRLERARQRQQTDVIRAELVQIQSQLNTLFRVLAQEEYRLAPTAAGEQAIAHQIWQQQSQRPLSFANILVRLAGTYATARLFSTRANAATHSWNMAKQEADNLYTDSLIAHGDSTWHLYDLTGRLGGNGLGQYNWVMPYLIAAANRFLPEDREDGEHDLNKRQINKIQSILSLFDENGRMNGFGYRESAIPLNHPKLMRFVIKRVPTRIFRWGESLIRTAHTDLNQYQTWSSWLKWGTAKKASVISCGFLRAILGDSFNSFEGTTLRAYDEHGVQRGTLTSSIMDGIKEWYAHPVWKKKIKKGLKLANYYSPEIRSGASTLNSLLENWKNCSTAEDAGTLRERRTLIPHCRETVHQTMQGTLDTWGQQWTRAQAA